MTLKKNDEYASTSLKKIIAISFVFIFVLGMTVIAGNTKVNSVKIKFSNNHEITVLTSKTKVSEILEDNRIVLAADEVVWPPLSEDITDAKTIKIMLSEEPIVEVAILSESDIADISDIEQKYVNITEKIETVREEIPFETITKDISNNSGNTTDRIIQYGKNGLKEITYKVTYQNDIEIQREELESVVIKEPINQIVQIQTRIVTSRSAGGAARGTTVATSGRYVVTAYCACVQCCGKTDGITASGVKATANRTIAAPRTFAFGTQLLINGSVYTVEDRGGAIQGNRLDIYMESHAEALRWAVRTVDVEILE